MQTPGLVPGATFANDFVIVAPLSEGGMGAVYVAEHRFTRQRCALKLMHAFLVADDGLRERFEQEAQVGAQIPSDHVVRVLSAGVDANTGSPWIAMELLAGADLDRVVRERGPLSHADARAVLRDVCHAVGAAHRAGIIHRDLKPANLFWAELRSTQGTRVVKVLDFGIAKVVAATRRQSTREGLGTPLWMAPEQAAGSAVSPATDVWALGLIAFFLLTGRSYWRAAGDPRADVHALLNEVLVAPLARASVRANEIGARLPAGFDEWFARAVTREPRDRFPDADACFRAFPAAGIDAFGPTVVGGAEASSLGETAKSPRDPLASTALGATALAPVATPAPEPALPAAPLPAPGAPRRRSPALWIAAGITFVAGCIAAARGIAAHGSRDAADAPTARPAGHGADACPTERCFPITIQDQAHVDAMDMLPAARRAARSLDATAVLERVVVMNASSDGTADLSAHAFVAYHFGAKGKKFQLTMRGAELMLEPAPLRAAPTLGDGPFCSARAARRAAARKIKDGSTTTMVLGVERGTAPAWYINAGTGGMAVVDGRSCELR